MPLLATAKLVISGKSVILASDHAVKLDPYPPFSLPPLILYESSLFSRDWSALIRIPPYCPHSLPPRMLLPFFHPSLFPSVRTTLGFLCSLVFYFLCLSLFSVSNSFGRKIDMFVQLVPRNSCSSLGLSAPLESCSISTVDRLLQSGVPC